ncbi:hypothetical protein Tco_0766115 [Tanacetum coccineum]
MTRSSTNELFTPYKEPEREFRSSRRHFKTLSLDELRSPDFNLLSDQEYSKEEEAEAMAETMEQYMSKTRTDYGSGVARPKIDNKDQFELKGQFLKELQENTCSGSDNVDGTKHIENVLENFDVYFIKRAEINNFQKEPDETLYQAWERFKELLMKCPQHYLTKMHEVILFYNGLDVPTRQILDLRGVVPTKTAEDAKKIKKVNEKVYAAQVGCGGYRATAPGYYQRNNANPSYHKRRQSMEDTLSKFMSESAKRNEENSKLIKEIRATTDAAIRNIGGHQSNTLEIQNGQSSKNIRSLSLEEFIELNDLNEPFELRRNQGDDLMPTIEEGEVIEEFKTRNEDLDTGIDDYPSYCDSDKKIHIDYAHNLKFSCMIGFEFTHVNFFPLLYVNIMSKKFHNSIMKDKMVYKGNNVVGAVMNVPIFVGTFPVVTDFAVLEDMNAYRDEGMGDVIVEEPFLREVGIKAKRFEGIITLYKSDNEVTYQMVRLHPRFKHHTNKECNKIPPLLKVSEKDEKNGISHTYQKLKGFYKGVLNLGPDYIQNAKTKEWLTRGHISVHEMQ